MLMMQFSAQSDVPPMDTWTPDEVKAHIEFMHEVNQRLTETGELVGGEGLAAPDQARIVRAGGGAPVVTDGPYPETKEFLVGFWVIECESLERATERAAYISAAPGPGGAPLNMPIEVRQVLSGPPEEL
ncbi:hypothetical protein DPM19_32290 [Actinomadura craniellae]|uniref:YCII-related domain-containing protein n=1 Tax=Actinomadura craniellae TaxID=2231787 RepID=A0A365GW87_9ACTN|nr:YciI family protein [Actinomadura craniellae]RAY11064.1 hypothetical protein DPM19_32290 [Actinomadura craniellae]